MIVCGGLAAVAGVAIILTMRLPGAVRVVLVLAWLAASLRELHGLARGTARLCALRLDADGRVAAVTRDGSPEPLAMLPGSIVLSRLAWLRVRFPDGSAHGELLRGDPAKDPAWQRLQLIWQLRRGAFGGP